MSIDFKQSLRDVFGKTLVELGKMNSKVVALDADLSSATKSIYFGKAYPDRFFNVGITEANMVSIGAGLSTCGLIPFVCSFSFLITLRAADQVRSQISYPGLPVKLIGTNGGLSGFSDGATHQSIMDLAVIRAMPNLTVFVPSDGITLYQTILTAAEIEGPVFVRVPRVASPVIHNMEMWLEPGRGILLRSGGDVTIIAAGLMVVRALDAADTLAAMGIDAEVIEVHTLKPLDEDMVTQSAAKTGAVVTVEEHNRFGGLTSAIAECLGRYCPVPLEYVAIEDHFAGSGAYEDLLKDCGLTAEHVVSKTHDVLKRKSKN